MPIAPEILQRLAMNDPAFIELDLSKTELTVADIQQLAQSLAECPTLKRLYLITCGIGEESAAVLAANSTLIELDLTGNARSFWQ